LRSGSSLSGPKFVTKLVLNFFSIALPPFF
jgi:hypothetical protein